LEKPIEGGKAKGKRFELTRKVDEKVFISVPKPSD
jgi:hypothetical protein